MSRVIVIQPGGGEAISGGTSVRHVKADIESLHLTEYSVEAAPMGDLHIHERHADAFYVLEGELEVALSETETARAGLPWPRRAPSMPSPSRSERASSTSMHPA